MTRDYFKNETPQNFDQWVGAAFLRVVGITQVETAAFIGVSDRTLRRREARPEWSQAVKEAGGRWLKDLDGRVRRVMEETVARLPGDLQAGKREAYNFVKWYAERRFPEFAPPAKKLQAELLEKRQYLVGAIPAGLIRRSRAPEAADGI